VLDFRDDDVRQRLEFFDLSEEESKLLKEARPDLARHLDEILERFYLHLTSQPHTREMLSVPGLIDRLKGLQKAYFESLTSGVYDRAYFVNRLRVGEAHDRSGLEPVWYIGAYLKYLHIVADVLRRDWGDTERYRRTMFAMSKVVHLDMSLALDAYYSSARGRLEAKNKALEGALEELKRLEAAKRTLTDMIVHDLQNPLTGIKAFLDLLSSREGGLSAGERGALEEALRRSNDLSQMILNVLQVSRAESGSLEVYVENVDAAALVREICKAYELHAKQEGRELVIDAPSPVLVRSDQTLLRRVLYNLLRNALRHTPKGTRVTVKVAPAGAGRAEVVVSDDGPGIPPEVHPMLFEKFGGHALRQAGLRVDTGLGLAFCKAAVEAVGGEIVVQSDGKSGTTFRVVVGACP
jgi:signal transduction histidine kinase